jgi:hypothetical protein
MKKKTVPPANRAVECYELLQLLSRRQMPVVCSAPEDIHLILALRSASLLKALTEPSVLSQTGERRIPRAIVTGLTAQGRAACMGYGTSRVGGGRPPC